MNQPRRDDEPGQQPMVDIPLSPEEIDDLLQTVQTVFSQHSDATQLLRRVGYPRERVPTFADHRAAWNEVFEAFENGIIDAPYRRMLLAALRVYRANPVLLELAAAHGLDSGETQGRRAAATGGTTVPEATPADTATTAAPAAEAPATCHVIVRAGDEDERLRAETELRALGMEPRSVWSTATAISFAVNTDDEHSVRGRMDRLDAFGWTVVPAGQPDYLLRDLGIEGPDRRRFRVTDAPSQETFRDIAEEVISGHYPQHDPGGELPTLIEHVQDGKRRSVNPDSTLHDAGVRDGDEMRVAYQTNAGALNPLRREAALIRARNQIRDFATGPAARDIDVELAANAQLNQLPTAYELRFVQPSFAYLPGTEESSREVVPVDRHIVSLQLGPEFPQTPPELWWMTPILHPNIYPNYPSPEARTRPELRGKVCLGIIGSTWQDAMDFADLCRMLVEMAGFRNYSPFEIVEGENGQPEFRGNSFDIRAARWVLHNQDRIRDIGGEFLFPHRPDRRTYRNVIEEITEAGR